MEHGVARRLTAVQYDLWKPHFVALITSAGLPGIMRIANELIQFDEFNRPKPLPTMDGGDLSETATSYIQMRYVLAKISEITGGKARGDWATAEEIELLSDDDVNFRFQEFARVMGDLAYLLQEAFEVPDSEECMYSELEYTPGNITVDAEGMPMALNALIMIAYIDSQIGREPGGTGMRQRELLEQELIALKSNKSLNLHDLKRLLDDLKQKVVSIQNRDPAIKIQHQHVCTREME
jgi:hypothetical protein